MKTNEFTDEQIAMAVRQAEAGTPVGAIWSANRPSTDGRSASGLGSQRAPGAAPARVGPSRTI
jgi:hypothetical protein